MVYADKAYCLAKAQTAMKKRGAASGAILKQNMKGKNKDLDRWRSGLRAPFEGVFSKLEKRARYTDYALHAHTANGATALFASTLYVLA